MIQPALADHLPEVARLFKTHAVVRAWAFGSVCTDRFGADSDIDFLIAFAPNLRPVRRGALHLSLYQSLEELLHRRVDLVPEDRIGNPFFLEVLNRTKTPIYAS